MQVLGLSELVMYQCIALFINTVKKNNVLNLYLIRWKGCHFTRNDSPQYIKMSLPLFRRFLHLCRLFGEDALFWCYLGGFFFPLQKPGNHLVDLALNFYSQFKQRIERKIHLQFCQCNVKAKNWFKYRKCRYLYLHFLFYITLSWCSSTDVLKADQLILDSL